MEIEGIMIMDLPLEEGVSKAGNPWKKKGWVLETFGQYPRKVKFDVFGERATTMNFECGKSYAVSVDVESREFNGRWYTDLKAFNFRVIENPAQGPMGGQTAQPQYQQPQQPQAQYPSGPQFHQPMSSEPAATQLPQADESEDLPF